jgi:hypothetical protein
MAGQRLPRRPARVLAEKAAAPPGEDEREPL